MRARQIKPGILKNEILGADDPLFTLLFEGLWMMADREGRLEDRPLRICAEVFPYRRKLTEKRVDDMLWWLAENKFIVRYENSSGRFISVVEFRKHQNPHKDERQSEIQGFTPESHRTRPVSSPKKPGKSMEVVGLIPCTPIPDSPIPCTHNPVPGVSTGADPVRNERKPALVLINPPALTYEQGRQLQETYPLGIYRQSEWLVAQKLINQHLANGVEFERILASIERYAAQCRAREIIGSQYVLSPVKLCDLDHPMFDEPFPLPKTKAEVRQDANADAGDAWLARQESENATG
jgi:hypothetical protein